jgi:hypothetical protein
MALTFSPPPGWPSPPSGWVPPEGWTPDPSWPPPPAGWIFWIDKTSLDRAAIEYSYGVAPTADIGSGERPPMASPRIGSGRPRPAEESPSAPAELNARGEPTPAGSAIPTDPGRKRRRLAPWIIGGAAVVAAALVAAGAFVVLNQGPPAPAGVRVSAVDGRSIRISWDPAANGAPNDRYLIERDGQEVGEVPGSASTYVDDNDLSPAKTYVYQVLAVSGSRVSAASAEQSGTAMAPSPTGLRATALTPTSIEVQWSPPGSSPLPEEYSVLRNGEPVATIEGSVSHWTDTKLAPATSYEYAVTAAWGSRSSEPSAVISVTTSTPSLASARLSGSWPVRMKVTRSAGGTWPKTGEKLDVTWDFTPRCRSGACSVTASVQITGDDLPFKLSLTRKGATYKGSTKIHYSTCRSKDVTNTVNLNVTVTQADMLDNEWLATGFKGTLTVISPYTTAGGGWYCPSRTEAMSLAGASA